jgi:UDP-N-acetyl-2-amino-2-deoxyglucuronate dehydrogenase
MSEERGMKTYGVGVYGIGWAAGSHIEAIIATPGMRVAALGSRNRDSAQKKKDEHCLKDCAVAASFEEMLKSKDVDIIDICTPNALHAEEAIAAARAGKHLIIEKPAVMNLAELKAVRDAVKKAGVKTQTCFELRWNPHVQCLRSMIDKGGLGKLFYVEVDYYHEIGPWWHGYTWGCNTVKGGPSATLVAGCHAVDLLLYFGGPVTEVMAYGCKGHRKDYEYDPTYAAIVKFANGTVGKTGNSFENESPYVMNMTLHGSGGSVYNEKFFTKEWFAGQAGWQIFNTVFLESGDVKHHPYKPMMSDLADSLVNDREPLNAIESSCRSHELCLAIDRSIATGRIVTLPLAE